MEPGDVQIRHWLWRCGQRHPNSCPKRETHSVVLPPWNDAFEAPLDVGFPSEILPPQHLGDESNYVDFQIICNQCGLFGRLLFEGHIRCGVFPFFLEQCELTVKPVGVRAAINLQLLFGGAYQNEMYGVPDLEKDFDLGAVPIPLPRSLAWHFNGLIDFGPEVKVQAGFRVESLQGSARLTAAFAVEIPDDSVMGLDLVHNPHSTSNPDAKLAFSQGWRLLFQV